LIFFHFESGLKLALFFNWKVSLLVSISVWTIFFILKTYFWQYSFFLLISENFCWGTSISTKPMPPRKIVFRFQLHAQILNLLKVLIKYLHDFQSQNRNDFNELTGTKRDCSMRRFKISWQRTLKIKSLRIVKTGPVTVRIKIHSLQLDYRDQMFGLSVPKTRFWIMLISRIIVGSGTGRNCRNGFILILTLSYEKSCRFSFSNLKVLYV
jgi:hypothetical protein